MTRVNRASIARCSSILSYNLPTDYWVQRVTPVAIVCCSLAFDASDLLALDPIDCIEQIEAAAGIACCSLAFNARFD